MVEIWEIIIAIFYLLGMSAAIAILMIVFGIPWLLGFYLLYVGKRFKDSAHEAGVHVDKSAFWLNWLAWVWFWAERSKEIVEAMPFFQKDLSENFGVKDDDGET